MAAPARCGHREAAADRVARVRRVEEKAPDPARREDGEVREDRVDSSFPVEDVSAEAGVLQGVPLGDVPRVMARRDEVDRGRLREERDVPLGGEPGEESRLDRPARRVGRVDDARHRVRAFAREVQVAVHRAREGHADRIEEDVLHDLGPAPREKRDGLRLAQARPGAEDVLDERARRVFLPEIDDAALGPRRVAVLGLLRLREDDDLDAAPRERERGGQARDARAEHENGRV